MANTVATRLASEMEASMKRNSASLNIVSFTFANVLHIHIVRPYPLGGYGYPTGYSNLLDIASYDTPEPYSGYYPDIEHDYGHHLHYDHGHGHEIYHDHSDHHHEHDHTISDAPVAQAAAENSQPSAAPARRRRVGRQRRSAGDDADQRIEYFFHFI